MVILCAIVRPMSACHTCDNDVGIKKIQYFSLDHVTSIAALLKPACLDLIVCR